MRTAMIVLVVLLAVGVFGLAAGRGPYILRQAFLDLVGDKLDWQSRWISGMGAVNCGYVEVGHDARAANGCVRAAFASGKAFRVRYGVESFDAEIDTALARSPQGRLYVLTTLYRSELLRQHVRLQDCRTELHETYGGRLSCLPDY
jgi:hypothetical protein